MNEEYEESFMHAIKCILQELMASKSSMELIVNCIIAIIKLIYLIWLKMHSNVRLAGVKIANMFG